MNRFQILSFISLFFITSCEKEDISPCKNLNNKLTEKVNFYCGTAVDLPRIFNNQNYNLIVSSQFNSVTAENCMKPDNLHPNEKTFNWMEADQLADYCAANAKRLHGHTLIWHQQLPDWILNYQGSKSDWEKLFEYHIYEIVSHFKGRVASWDVVNEAFNLT